MSNSSSPLRTYPFNITDSQLEELIWDLNDALLKCRRAISPDRNADPYSHCQFLAEHYQIYIQSINSEHGSMYVRNIQLDKIDFKLIINACITKLTAASREADAIESVSQFQDDARAMNWEIRLRTFEDPLTTAQWYDQLVASELAEAFLATTGQKPTMGGYKRPSQHSNQPAQSTPEIRSPFTVFALYLIRIAKLKRLGVGGFTVGVLRKAMGPYWQSKRMLEGGEAADELERNAPADPGILPRRRRGRPSKGNEPAKVRDEGAVKTDICSAAELAAMNWEEFDVD